MFIPKICIPIVISIIALSRANEAVYIDGELSTSLYPSTESTLDLVTPSGLTNEAANEDDGTSDEPPSNAGDSDSSTVSEEPVAENGENLDAEQNDESDTEVKSGTDEASPMPTSFPQEATPSTEDDGDSTTPKTINYSKSSSSPGLYVFFIKKKPDSSAATTTTTATTESPSESSNKYPYETYPDRSSSRGIHHPSLYHYVFQVPTTHSPLHNAYPTWKAYHPYYTTKSPVNMFHYPTTQRSYYDFYPKERYGHASSNYGRGWTDLTYRPQYHSSYDYDKQRYNPYWKGQYNYHWPERSSGYHHYQSPVYHSPGYYSSYDQGKEYHGLHSSYPVSSRESYYYPGGHHVHHDSHNSESAISGQAETIHRSPYFVYNHPKEHSQESDGMDWWSHRSDRTAFVGLDKTVYNDNAVKRFHFASGSADSRSDFYLNSKSYGWNKDHQNPQFTQNDHQRKLTGIEIFKLMLDASRNKQLHHPQYSKSSYNYAGYRDNSNYEHSKGYNEPIGHPLRVGFKDGYAHHNPYYNTPNNQADARALFYKRLITLSELYKLMKKGIERSQARKHPRRLVDYNKTFKNSIFDHTLSFNERMKKLSELYLYIKSSLLNSSKNGSSHRYSSEEHDNFNAVTRDHELNEIHKRVDEIYAMVKQTMPQNDAAKSVSGVSNVHNDKSRNKDGKGLSSLFSKLRSLRNRKGFDFDVKGNVKMDLDVDGHVSFTPEEIGEYLKAMFK